MALPDCFRLRFWGWRREARVGTSGHGGKLTVDGDSPTSFSYDAYGNQTQVAVAFNAVTTSTYDLGDRLISITPPGSSATTFSLDALGRHASRTTGSVTDTYAYLGTSETAWQITTGSSTLSAAREPSGALAGIDAAGTDGFPLADLHGNTGALVNAADTAYLSATRYDAFGQSAASYDSGGSYPTPWGFQSRLDVSPDAAEPLYDVSARFYSPSIGAFTQLDTYAGAPGDPLSLNRYLYAAANPWTLIDPSGHKAEMGAGSGTMTQDQYVDQLVRQISQVAAPLRTAIQQIRETDLAVYTTTVVQSPNLIARDVGVVSAYWDVMRGQRAQASTLALILGGSVAGDTSAAGRLLPSVGRGTAYARSGLYQALVKAGPLVPVAGGLAAFGGNVLAGESIGEAGTRAVFSTGGAWLSGSAAIAGCGAAGLATAGAGLAACGVAAVISSVGGGAVGDAVGEFMWEWAVPTIGDVGGSVVDTVTFWDN